MPAVLGDLARIPSAVAIGLLLAPPHCMARPAVRPGTHHDLHTERVPHLAEGVRMTDLILDRLGIAALADARHHSRAALAALRAMDLTPVSRDSRLQISQAASQLADVIDSLATLEQRARLQP